MQVEVITCPCCGAGLNLASKNCEYCGREVLITRYSSLNALNNLQVNNYQNLYSKYGNQSNIDMEFATAIVFLKLKQYDFAISKLEKIISFNPTNSHAYYLYSLTLFKGKRPFLAKLDIINKAIDALNSANMLNPCGVHYFLLGFIAEDFFERKFLHGPFDSDNQYLLAKNCGVSNGDIEEIKEILNV